MSRPASTRGAIFLAVGVIAAVGIVAFGVASLLGGGEEEAETIEPVALSEAELAERAGEFDHPVYWVGPRPDTAYELTQTADGRVYVRYLASGAAAGDPRPTFITVGTYPVTGAAQTLAATAALGSGGLSREEGRTLLPGQTDNAYIVFDAQPNLQIELFTPKPGQALELAQSEQLEPIE